MPPLLKFLTAPRRNFARASHRFRASTPHSQISRRHSRLFSPGDLIFSLRITTLLPPVTAFLIATHPEIEVLHRKNLTPPNRNTFHPLPANLQTRKIAHERRRNA
jgi:hypothetical protein